MEYIKTIATLKQADAFLDVIGYNSEEFKQNVKDSLKEIEVAISVTRCSTQFVCEHRWTHNTHSDTKYCSKGCDGFKIHEAN